MKRLTWTPVVAALAAVAACTGQVAQPGVSTGPATVRPVASPAQGNQPPATSTGFVMCSLVPGGDVQSRTPFTIPLKDAVPTSNSTQGCLYSFSGNKDLASVLLTVTDFDSQADALTALHSKEQAFRENLNLEPQPVAGVGDEAAAFPGGDEVGVEAVIGTGWSTPTSRASFLTSATLRSSQRPRTSRS